MANGVPYIVDQEGTDNWNHVESHYNPADLASGGISAKEPCISDIWWKGLQWLPRPYSEWPQSAFKPNNQLETRFTQVNVAQTDMSE